MVTRRLLPSQSLAELAAAEGFGLPPRFRAPYVPDADREQVRASARDVLVAAGAARPDGSTELDLSSALRALAAPTFVVEIDVCGPPPGAGDDVDHDVTTRAAAWTAYLAGDAERLVVLLRRDVLPIAELSTGSLAEVSGELGRLLTELPADTSDAAREEVVFPLELITLLDGARRTGGQPEAVAAFAGADPTLVREVLSVVRDADASLQIRVSTPSAGSVTVGLVLWYRTASGWWQLDAVPQSSGPPSDGQGGQRLARLRPVRTEDAVSAVAPLVALALPLQVES